MLKCFKLCAISKLAANINKYKFIFKIMTDSFHFGVPGVVIALYGKLVFCF